MFDVEFLRNFTEIGFAAIGSGIAILTYVAAKETILQPVRSEVMKKQTDLLTEIITSLGKGSALDEKINYQKLLEVNILNSMLACGAIFSSDDVVKENIKKNTAFSLVFPDASGELEGYELVEMFSSVKENKAEKVENSKEAYLNAKQGKYTLSQLLITKEVVVAQEELGKWLGNPFLPLSIKNKIEKLLGQVQENISSHVKKAVEKGVNESFTSFGGKLPNLGGLSNVFNRLRVRHEQSIIDLNSEIRKYLKIDSMP